MPAICKCFDQFVDVNSVHQISPRSLHAWLHLNHGSRCKARHCIAVASFKNTKRPSASNRDGRRCAFLCLCLGHEIKLARINELVQVGRQSIIVGTSIVVLGYSG